METAERNDPIHTRCNIEDSDRTLILNRGKREGGTALTARHVGKPCLIVALEEGIKPEAFQDVAGRQSHYRLKSKSLKKSLL